MNTVAMNAFRSRARTIAPYALVAAFFAAVLATSHRQTEYLPAQDFAGCYMADNAEPLMLLPDGSIHAAGKRAGSYKVLAPVGGKHGPQIEATGIDVSFRNGRVTFTPGSGGFFWNVTDSDLTVVFAPDGLVRFAKSLNSPCN